MIVTAECGFGGTTSTDRRLAFSSGTTERPREESDSCCDGAVVCRLASSDCFSSDSHQRPLAAPNGSSCGRLRSSLAVRMWFHDGPNEATRNRVSPRMLDGMGG